MTKSDIVRRVREKLIKLQTYHHEAVRTYGKEIAKDMFKSDMDYLTSILLYIGTDEKGN